MTTAVPTIAVFPEERLTQSQKIEKWVWQLCRSLEQNYEHRYPNSSDPVTFSMESGRKYWKINQNGGGVHAFVKGSNTIGSIADKNAHINKSKISEEAHKKKEATPEAPKAWYHKHGDASSKEINSMTNKQKAKYIMEGKK